MEKKDKLRKALKKQRSQLSLEQQRQKSHDIAQHVLNSKIFKAANSVGYYHAVQGEADPQILFTLHEQKKFYLPVVTKDSNAPALLFAPVSPTTQYQNNIFTIPEPICEVSDMLRAEDLDLLIVPLLGFDKNGHRLGMGGGFYDRTLSYKQENPKKKPVLMGFAYDFQEISNLQAEAWDIGLDWIATESALYNLAKSGRS